MSKRNHSKKTFKKLQIVVDKLQIGAILTV